MKKVTLILLLATLLFCGVVRIQLVAQQKVGDRPPGGRVGNSRQEPGIEPLTEVQSAIADLPPGTSAATFHTDPDYVKLLQKRAEVAKAKTHLIETKVTMGGQGGNTQNLYLSQIAQAEAEASLYRYTGDRENFLVALTQKADTAKQLVNVITSTYNSGLAQVTDVQDAELTLAEAEFELAKVKKETNPVINKGIIIYSPQHSGANADGYVAISERNAFVFDGKTFWEWEWQARTELNPERHVEIVKAFGAFARKGFGKEATEAILKLLEDILEEYPEFLINVRSSYEGNIKDVVSVTFIARIPAKDSVPIILEQYKVSQGQKKNMLFDLLEIIVRNRTVEQIREQLADSPEVLTLFDALVTKIAEPKS